MALIKCSECGKEISDKASSCPKCGYPVEIKKEEIVDKKHVTKDKKNNNNLNNKKANNMNILYVIVGILFLLLLIVIVAKIENKEENNESSKGNSIELYYGEDCPHCEELINYIDSLDENILKQVTINKYEVWYNTDNQNKMNRVAKERGEEPDGVPYLIIGDKSWIGFEDKYKSEILEAINNLIKKNGGEEVIDNRTPKQKFIDYVKKTNKDATCTESKCTWTFTLSYLNDTSYYTIDFENKKFTYESFRNGSSYDEYNYGNDTAHSKNVMTVGWTTTTTMDITFNDDGTYHWDCWSDLPNYCESSGSTIAELPVSLRDQFLRYCSEAGVSRSDL